MQSASVGQTISAGATVVILESMKLEIPVETPKDGTVTWMAAAGTVVDTNDVVAIVDV